MPEWWQDFKREVRREYRYTDWLERLILIGSAAFSLWYYWEWKWWQNALGTFLTVAMAWMIAAWFFYPAPRE